MPKPTITGYSHPGRGDVVFTEGAAPASGKVMVARALRSTSPLCKVIRASHGPAGSALSKTIVTGSVSPIARVVPRVAGYGPALSPPGPPKSSRVPFMSSARPPVLCTVARTTGCPSVERLAVNETIETPLAPPFRRRRVLPSRPFNEWTME